jgi:hypothetical protein
MRSKIFSLIVIAGALLLFSCGNSKSSNENRNSLSANTILQQVDGTISLELKKADCYSDKKDPSLNTAEWSVKVLKSGRFNVWLSSATKDTTSLNYHSNVLVSVHDTRISGHPACDKIIRNSSDVSYPYFRADSFMGSLYIQDTGEYNIQVISEKILPENLRSSAFEENDMSKLLSVFFTPESR